MSSQGLRSDAGSITVRSHVPSSSYTLLRDRSPSTRIPSQRQVSWELRRPDSQLCLSYMLESRVSFEIGTKAWCLPYSMRQIQPANTATRLNQLHVLSRARPIALALIVLFYTQHGLVCEVQSNGGRR